jgi:hypothetical protein
MYRGMATDALGGASAPTLRESHSHNQKALGHRRRHDGKPSVHLLSFGLGHARHGRPGF